MKYISEISFLMILICVILTVQSSPLKTTRTTTNFRHTRVKRGDWFRRSTTSRPLTTTLPPQNDFDIGLCKEDDKVKKVLYFNLHALDYRFIV